MSSLKKIYSNAQTMMEYLLIMVIVVVIVFGALSTKTGGVLDKTRDTAEKYFLTGSAAIVGGYYESNAYHQIEPQKIDGDWCPSKTVNGRTVRECACPRPAFGGRACY
ncbi:MAG: hypothetical protein V2A70_00120 [Candidatus Omnitrophota bacterium]